MRAERAKKFNGLTNPKMLPPPLIGNVPDQEYILLARPLPVRVLRNSVNGRRTGGVWFTRLTLSSWPLCITPAHSRVGEGVRLLCRNPIDWLRNACGRNATERRKPLRSCCAAAAELHASLRILWLARPSHLTARGAKVKERSSGSND